MNDAIKQAIEALESCTDGDYSSGHVIHPHFDRAMVEAALAALRAQPASQSKYGPRINFTNSEVEFHRLTGEIQRLAVSIWDKHYRNTAPYWTVLSDAYGALSQISNMVAGMAAQPDHSELIAKLRLVAKYHRSDRQASDDAVILEAANALEGK